VAGGGTAPGAAARRRRGSPEHDAPAEEPRLRALVVDDDSIARRLVGQALAALGFEVLTAPDGECGLRMLSEDVLGVDLLLTDVWMPSMDGGALIRTVRRGGETDLAIVAMTGCMKPGLEHRIEQDGADALLDKALGADIIARAAQAVVARRRRAA
jgi:CheY-like chemotaxis protein